MRRQLAFVIGLVLAAIGRRGMLEWWGQREQARAASTAAATTTTAPVPGAEWEKVAPAAVGLDAAKLDQIAQVAEAGKSSCLVVVRDGKLAGEWYFRGTNDTAPQTSSR